MATDYERRVMDYLRDRGGEATTEEIAAGTRLPVDLVRMILNAVERRHRVAAEEAMIEAGPSQVEAVILAWLQGNGNRSVAEIAAGTGLSETAVNDWLLVVARRGYLDSRCLPGVTP